MLFIVLFLDANAVVDIDGASSENNSITQDTGMSYNDTAYYVCVETQQRGPPHLHDMIWAQATHSSNQPTM